MTRISTPGRPRSAPRAPTALLACLLPLACGTPPADEPRDVPPDESAVVAEPPSAEPDDSPRADPGEAAGPTDADDLMPPLEGYRTDDAVETGEVEASLDHGPVPYREVRRRLIMDDEGFTRGEVVVVTLEAEPGAADAYLGHVFGDAGRETVEVGGRELVRLDAEPFPVLAWVGPDFVVTFSRGQAASDEWLEELAAATLSAVRSGAS